MFGETESGKYFPCYVCHPSLVCLYRILCVLDHFSLPFLHYLASIVSRWRLHSWRRWTWRKHTYCVFSQGIPSTTFVVDGDWHPRSTSWVTLAAPLAAKGGPQWGLWWVTAVSCMGVGFVNWARGWVGASEGNHVDLRGAYKNGATRLTWDFVFLVLNSTRL